MELRIDTYSAYLYFNEPGKPVHSTCITASGINIDFDANGRVMGIEFCGLNTLPESLKDGL